MEAKRKKALEENILPSEDSAKSSGNALKDKDKEKEKEKDKEQLNQSEKIIKNLNQNKMLYDKKKSEIENEINAIQNKTENKINTIKSIIKFRKESPLRRLNKP